MEKIIVYTAGVARGNPGPAGVGIYITTEDGGLVHETKKAIGNATSDFAEYYAVMMAMGTLSQIYGDDAKDMHFEFRFDSDLVNKQLNNEVQIKEPGLVPMFIEIHNNRVSSFPNITFTHLPRTQNKEAERLSNEAVDGKM